MNKAAREASNTRGFPCCQPHHVFIARYEFPTLFGLKLPKEEKQEMKRKSVRMLIRVFLSGSILCLFAAMLNAQDVNRNPKQTSTPPAVLSVADGLSLTSRIKEVESPTFRAYLYSRVSSWIWQGSGQDEMLQRVAVDASVAGIADIHKHYDEIPHVVADGFYTQLLGIVHNYNPQEAARLRRSFPLAQDESVAEEARANGAFYSATAKLESPRPSDGDIERAARLIDSGSVPPSVLLGELARLDHMNSPALPQLMASTLALEERAPGAIPLRNMFFLSHIFLKETTPTSLQVRFLRTVSNATHLPPVALRSDQARLSSAVQLLQRSLPFMRKLTPELYAEASARFAALAPGIQPEDSAFDRIKKSPTPLDQALSEAESTKDARRKRELVEYAARIAKQEGKLKLAVELIASTLEENQEQSSGYSRRDELLDELLQASLSQADLETARLATASIGLATNQARAMQRMAQHFVKTGAPQSAIEMLNEAAKRLKDAPDEKEKAIAYLHLVTDLVGLDQIRASELLSEAVRAVNRIQRSGKDSNGALAKEFFPVADAAVKAFRAVAGKDREGTLSTAESFQSKEFKVAAVLGVYSSHPE